MKKTIYFLSIFLFFIPSLLAGQEDSIRVLSTRLAKKLEKRFSKRAFVRQLNASKEDYEKMVTRIKDFSIASGQLPCQNSDSLNTMYEDTQNAFNTIIDSLIKEINAKESIVEYALFDINQAYLKPLEEATALGNKFLKNGEQMLSGDTQFISKQFNWSLLTIFSLINRFDDSYLDDIKSIISEQLREVKFSDWCEV